MTNYYDDGEYDLETGFLKPPRPGTIPPYLDAQDYPYDVDPVRAVAPRTVAPQTSAAERAAITAAQTAALERRRQEQVLYLTLLAQGSNGGPVTEVTSPINGDFINAEYQPIFTNNTNNPVRIQVFADLVSPGCGAILSFTRDLSDVGKFDVLSLTANGRTESVTALILPTYSVWARDFQPVFFPMLAVDILRLRVFDPMKLLSYGNLYPELRSV
jgi:hypothetical protein